MITRRIRVIRAQRRILLYLSKRLQGLHCKPAIARVNDGAGGDVVFPSRIPEAQPLHYSLILQGGTTGSTTVKAVLGMNMPTLDSVITFPTKDRYSFGGYYTETNDNSTTTYNGTAYYNKDKD